MDDFIVEEHGCEPVAYAAAVLPLMPLEEPEQQNADENAHESEPDVATAEPKTTTTKLQNGASKKTRNDVAASTKIASRRADTPRLRPTTEGVPFGVFDFGGGTTDFAIGLYRLPTPDEAEQGLSEVLDIYDTSGDPNLGGEHLIHLLCYEVVLANKTVLQQGNTIIPFVKHIEAPDTVPGAERLFGNSAIARANTHKLCEALRPLWEQGSLEDLNQDDQISLLLQNAVGEECPNTKLGIDAPHLISLLQQRIQTGVEKFFATFRQAFRTYAGHIETFHILLAGNSCKSPLVTEAFARQIQGILKGDAHGKIIVHPPLLPEPQHPQAVTLKTGVAIGILKTLDTEPIGMCLRNSSSDETPFNFTVGSLNNGHLKPLLQRNTPYHQEVVWGTLVRNSKILVLYSASPFAPDGKIERGSGDCRETVIKWDKSLIGSTVVMAAITHDTVQFFLKDAQNTRIANSERNMVCTV